jgi:hypothetical protein
MVVLLDAGGLGTLGDMASKPQTVEELLAETPPRSTEAHRQFRCTIARRVSRGRRLSVTHPNRSFSVERWQWPVVASEPPAA